MSYNIFNISKLGVSFMENTEKQKQDRYFKTFVKYGYFFVSVLLSALALTLLVAIFDYDLITAINSVKNLTLYMGIAVGIIGLFTLIYLLAKIRCERLSIADSLGFSLIVTGIGTSLYFALIVQRFDQTGIRRIIIGATIFILGITYLLLRLTFFKKHERRKIIFIKNSLTGYFSLIGQKYSFMSVILTGIVACAVMHLALTSSFANYVATSFIYDKAFLIIMSVTAVCFLLYLVIEVSNKHVTPVDLLISSGIVFFPISVLNVVLLKPSIARPLTFIAIAFAFYLVLLIVRINCFDITAPEKHDKKHFSDIILEIAISTLLVGGTALLIHSNAINGSLPLLGNVGTPHCITFFPVIVIALAIAASVLFNLTTSIINVNGKKLNGSDVLSDVSFITSILSFSLIAIYPSIIFIAALVAFFLMNLTIFIARKRVLASNAKRNK